jgi:hypothetical protein
MDKEEIDNGCTDCGCKTNDVCWSEQNKLRAQWLIDNPNSQYIGWTSI